MMKRNYQSSMSKAAAKSGGRRFSVCLSKTLPPVVVRHFRVSGDSHVYHFLRKIDAGKDSHAGGIPYAFCPFGTFSYALFTSGLSFTAPNHFPR